MKEYKYNYSTKVHKSIKFHLNCWELQVLLMRDDKTLLLSKIILGTIIHLSLFVKYLIHIKVDSEFTFFFIFLVDLIRRFLCLLLFSRQLFAIILSGDQIVFYLSLTQMRFSSDNLYPICQKFESFWFGIKCQFYSLFQ